MAGLDRLNILLVDDRMENLIALESILDGPDRNLMKATSGDDALSLVLEHDFALVLLDVQMPGMDGFETAALMRGVERVRHVPIIFVTAIGREAKHEFKGYESGAVDYLHKPVEPEILKSKVRVFLDLARQKKELGRLNDRLVLAYRESERLLLNILPKPVANELKAKGTYDPVKYDDVSVLFTDFEGFTRIAESYSPQQLVDELGSCFNAFDDIVDHHHLEKLKTLGDGYMCAGGVPNRNTTHAIDCVLAALEMLDFVAQKHSDASTGGRPYWSVRIGIHTGTAMAGVIGKKKFAYDLWGDTVNLASRMESAGVAGKVNISGQTYERVKDFFLCEHRGKVAAKNKGDIDMYLVSGIRPELCDNPIGSVQNTDFREKYHFVQNKTRVA